MGADCHPRCGRRLADVDVEDLVLSLSPSPGSDREREFTGTSSARLPIQAATSGPHPRCVSDVHPDVPCGAAGPREEKGGGGDDWDDHSDAASGKAVGPGSLADARQALEVVVRGKAAMAIGIFSGRPWMGTVFRDCSCSIFNAREEKFFDDEGWV